MIDWTKIHPFIAQNAKEVEQKLADMGYPIFFYQGYRTYEEQDADYAKGRTIPGKIISNAKGGQSFHNFGLALDAAFVGGDSFSLLRPWDTYGEVATTCGFVWGGSWRMKDRPHIEMACGLSLNELDETFRSGGLDAVFKQVDVAVQGFQNPDSSLK